MKDTLSIPRHIAIIMDGNGRWAREKKLPRSAGHLEGIKRVKEIVRQAAAMGVGVLTLFAFSAENWNRPKREVGMLMRSLVNFLDKEIKELDRNNVRFMVIGRDEPLPEYVRAKLGEAKARTLDNTGLVLVLALNYGARQEIVDAAKNFARQVLQGKAQIDGFKDDAFQDYLYTAGLPDPDLLIRTSGEMRISNFLLWQISYSELFFSPKYWPDFKKEDLALAIEEFNKRERRFGKIDVRKKAR
jgi:undecaprenyl diphosphate synthase